MFIQIRFPLLEFFIYRDTNGKEAMNKKKLKAYRELLMDELRRLMGEASGTLNGMSNEKALFPDPTDRAALEADRNFLLRIRDRERRLILKIREALGRIDDETFGICQGVRDEDISDSRLKARPVCHLFAWSASG